MHQKGLGTRVIVNPQFVHWESMTTQEESVGIHGNREEAAWGSLIKSLIRSSWSHR